METLYPEELKPFFQDRLRIAPASLRTLVEGLCSLAELRPLISDVKDMIWAINAMDPKESDLTPLMARNVLPVRRWGNSAGTTLQNCGNNFTVLDRTKLADIFREHVGFLDFSLEEVQQLDPFLQALGLSRKCLSRVCTEETACRDDGVIERALTEKFKDRAYHLLRYGKLFLSMSRILTKPAGVPFPIEVHLPTEPLCRSIISFWLPQS